MRPTHFIAAGLIAASMPTIFRRLQRRHIWEQRNRRAYLAIHLQQVSIAATRAGLPLPDMLHECRHRGATHVAIVEDTLDSLLQRGEIVQLTPVEPGTHRFAAARSELAARIRAEFAVRAPHALVGPKKDAGDEHAGYIILAGDLAALRPIALGFDPDLCKMARGTGLQLIASPRSYAWSETAAIERTLAQAAQLGARIIAFADDPVLGHEMRLNDTIASLRRHRLFCAYFADSRHQRGDWFIAKALPEQTLLSYRFTQAQLNAADEGSLAYEAGLRAREGGIRLIFADTDIGVHAIVPSDIYRFLDALAHDLIGHGGFIIDIPDHSHEHEDAHGHSHDDHHNHAHDSGGGIPDPLPVEKIVPAVARIFHLPAAERIAAPFEYSLMLPAAVGLSLLSLDRMAPLSWPAALGLGGSAFVLASSVLPRLDRPSDALTATFTPSYTAKLLSLAALVAGPASGQAGLLGAPAAGLLAAAATANPDYHLRIETLRTMNLDWSLPLAWQLAAEPPGFLAGHKRWLAAALILAGPMLLRSRLSADLIDTLDREHPSGHTHHLSAAQRTLGDARMAFSPQPLRKWGGLTLLWLLHASLSPRSDARALVGLAATAGGIAAAGTLRNPSRAIALSIAHTLRSDVLLAPAVLLSAALAQTRNRVRP